MKEGKKKDRYAIVGVFLVGKVEDSGSTSYEFFEWLGAVLP